MFETIVILALVLLNGALALSEIAVVSAKRVRLLRLIDDKVYGAETALRLNENPGLFLPTIQVGMTLISIVAGAFSGVAVAEKLQPIVAIVPILGRYADTITMPIVIVVVSFLTLILGELVPKHIAILAPERLAALVAKPIMGLAMATAPIVWVLSKSSQFVLFVLRLHKHTPAPLTEEEVTTLIEEGEQIGIFATAERQMISGVLSLADRSVRSIMTPRPDISWIDVKAPPDALRKKVYESPYSHLLVSDGTIEKVVGIVKIRDALSAIVSGREYDAHKLMSKPLIVHDGTTVLKLLDILRGSKHNIAVVVDEYGGLEGIVSITDIMETIAGALPEPGAKAEPNIVQRGESSWLIDGMTSMDEVEEATGFYGIQDVKDGYNTLAGFILSKLGHIPKTGETLQWQGVTFEIVDMDGRRIDKVAVIIKPQQ